MRILNTRNKEDSAIIIGEYIFIKDTYLRMCDLIPPGINRKELKEVSYIKTLGISLRHLIKISELYLDNEPTLPENWIELSKHENKHVRALVAKNNQCLKELLRDESEWVRRCAKHALLLTTKGKLRYMKYKLMNS